MTEFINGVEYLYTIPAEEPISYWYLILIFFLAFVLFKVLTYLSSCPIYDDVGSLKVSEMLSKIARLRNIVSIIWAMIITLLSFAIIDAYNNNNIKPERYAVNISDEVSLNEFADNYTIVEQKGNVYIIEVKDNEHD